MEFLLSIPMNWLQRVYEYQADRFSVEADESFGPFLKSGLKKLMKESKVNLTPHPLKVFLSFSHPPLLQRMEAIDEHCRKVWNSNI